MIPRAPTNDKHWMANTFEKGRNGVVHCAIVSVCIFKENNWDLVVMENSIAEKFVANIKCFNVYSQLSTPMENR